MPEPKLKKLWVRAFFPAFSIAAALLLSCGRGEPHHLPYNILPPVVVEDLVVSQRPEGFRLASALNERKVALVFFGYTHCPDVCPDTLKRLGTALGRLSESRRAQILVLFVSVDERESPVEVENYVRLFHPAIVGMAPRGLARIKVTSDYGVLAAEQGKALDHSSSVLWIENGLKLRKRIAPGFSVDALVHDLTLATSPI